MGLGGFLKKALDPGDVIGGLTGSTGREAAAQAAEVTNAELLRQFELSQENLSPSLEAAQRQLPGIEGQLTPEGFGDTLTSLSAGLDQFLAPTRAGRSEIGSRQLMQAGITPGAGVSQELSQIDPATMAELLTGAEADLFSNRISLAGLGQGAGGVLSELGQRTGAGIAESNINAQIAGQKAQAAGTSNALSLAGLAASFFSDEGLKDNIEVVGEYKGVPLIRWTWKDFVPQRWRDVTVGFSAQYILKHFPQFVHEKSGFLAINKDGLINHLEAM